MSAELAALEAEVRVCPLCVLSRTRTRAVPGDGLPTARIMIVGEAPGQNEDQQGLPFVGAAGQLLAKLLGYIGLSREDAYITNILKCRPPGNRDPLPEEVTACAPYLDRQIAIIRPAVILLLGRHAVQRLLPGSDGISRIHGEMIERHGRVYVPLYHPAAALYNGFLVETLKQDMIKVRGYIDLVEQRRAAAAAPVEPPPDPHEQMSLF
ncbi:MAG TPA: uracil-DNA glycosylase [Candidatus Dormibacteraeota bacterium]|nr:uracil-DNA glycosylase [Candidatus Dormibacteraeota bacterium]